MVAPKVDIEDPRRPKERKDTLDPKVTKSKTERFDPNLDAPKTDRADPNLLNVLQENPLPTWIVSNAETQDANLITP